MKRLLILCLFTLIWAAEYEVSVRPDPDHKGIFNIYVRDTVAEKRELVLTSNTIVATHPHPAEYHRKSLYVLQQGKKNMELWKYSDNRSALLATGKFLSFRTSNDDKYCLVTDGKTLSIITTSGKQTLSYKRFLGRSEIGTATGISLIKWSTNDKLLWGAVQTGRQTTSLWSFDRNTWKIERYPVRALAMSGEYALHTETLRLLYTTPAKPNKRKLSLRWYDLQKNTGGEIVSANVGYYDPRWLDKNNIDFVPPSRKKRVLYNIQ